MPGYKNIIIRDTIYDPKRNITHNLTPVLHSWNSRTPSGSVTVDNGGTGTGYLSYLIGADTGADEYWIRYPIATKYDSVLNPSFTINSIRFGYASEVGSKINFYLRKVDKETFATITDVLHLSDTGFFTDTSGSFTDTTYSFPKDIDELDLYDYFMEFKFEFSIMGVHAAIGQVELNMYQHANSDGDVMIR